MQKAGLAIYLLLTSSLVLAAPPSPRCASVQQILEIVLLEKPVFKKLERWRNFPGGAPDAQHFVDDLLSLSPEDRALVLKRVVRMPSSNPMNDEILKLLLFHEPSWKFYLRQMGEAMKNPELLVDDGHFTAALEKAVQQMPEELSEKLLGSIPELYPKIKRQMDSFIRVRIPAHDMIREGIENGKTAWQAYETYFSKIQSYFKSTPYGDYSASDVLDSLRSIRAWVKSLPRDVLTDRKVTVFGSFPNGKARLGFSDVDLNSPSQKQKLALERYVSFLKTDLNHALKKKHPHAALEVGNNYVAPSHTSQKSPIHFEVTPDGIDLLVYPRAGAEPLKYRIE